MKTNQFINHRVIWLLVPLLTLFNLSAWADSSYTIGWGTASGTAGTYTNFTTTSGNVTNIVSFTTAQNDGTTSPTYNSNNNDLRLYYGSSTDGNGGSITLTPASGKVITGFVMTTSTSPSVKYSVDGGSATSVSVSSNTYTVSSISAYSSVTIQNVNTTNTQLRIKTIQISYTTAPSYSVTWLVNGENWNTGHGTPSTSVYAGSKVTDLPTEPTTAACDNSKVFVGWTNSSYSHASDAPTVLFKAASAAPTVSANTTYYAVFATATAASKTVTYPISLLDNFGTPSGTAPAGSSASIAETYTTTKQMTEGNSQTVTLTGWGTTNITNITLSMKSNKSSGAGKLSYSTNSGSTYSYIVGSSSAGVAFNNASWYGAWSQSYVDISKTVNFTGTANNTIKIKIEATASSIYCESYSITYAGTNYTYYVTTCETCADPTALGKGSFNSSTHVQPITWTSEAGKVDICYSTSSTEPDDSPGSGYTVISGQTGSTSTSNTYNLDVSSLAPGNYYVWARSVCSASASSDWKAMASPGYFTLPGYTLSIAKSGGGSSSTTDPAVGDHSVTVGNSVSITASPASGYLFTSWSKTAGTLSSTTDNPTTFTMGNANATVTATFSEIKVSSLSLKATQTGESDKTGNDLTMSMYPGEGQASDPLEHSATVKFNQVLPADALDQSYTWSVRVKASGAADWTAVSFSDNELGTNAVLQKFNKNTGTLQAKAAGEAEIKITANDGSGVSAKVTITVTNVALTSLNVGKSSTTLYMGQTEEIAVTYTPANTTTKGYTTGSYTYVKKESTSTNAKIVLTGKSVTKQESETVTLTSSDAGAKTATIAVTIKPLPLVHFVDIIHNEEFDNVVATTDGTTVTFAKTVPTHDDLDVPGSGNDCEKEHLHLIGWIRSDYTKVANYMNGTADAPTNEEITGAGTGYYYTAGADITLTDAMHGKTFYAVWAKTE